MSEGTRARLFFALMLGAELGERLVRETEEALGGAAAARQGFRLPRAGGLHLTLLFLGDVAREEIDPLWSGVGDPARAPKVVIEGTGAFPKPGRERVLWFGVREDEDPGRLAALRQRVLAAARGAGHDTRSEESRPFAPHVTVARPRGGARVPAAFYDLRPALAWNPRALALVEAVHDASGPAHYRPIRELLLEP